MYILNPPLKSMSLLKLISYMVAFGKKVILFANSSLCENNTFLLNGVISTGVLYPIPIKKLPYSFRQKSSMFF
jgi:hypothetical protein